MVTVVTIVGAGVVFFGANHDAGIKAGFIAAGAVVAIGVIILVIVLLTQRR